jgi:hypothetical protein
VIIVKRVAGANNCRVNRGGADLIDGNPTVSLNAVNNFVHVVANRNGNAWHVIGIG